MVQEYTKIKSDRLKVWKFLLTILVSSCLLTFLFIASQFTEPDVPFIPKSAASSHHYFVTDPSVGWVGAGVVERSYYQWPVKFEKEAAAYVREIERMGYRRQEVFSNKDWSYTFQNSTGDILTLKGISKGDYSTDSLDVLSDSRPNAKPTGAELTFTHAEKRSGYTVVKRTILWFKNLRK